MRKVFLDIGSHTGQSVHEFYQEVDNAADWHVFCFEPLAYSTLKHSMAKYANVSCLKVIVAATEGLMDIYPVPHAGQGATTLKGKVTGNVWYDAPVAATCIDIVRWFGGHIKDDDFVIVKMNIEGGEYALMPRLPEILPKIAGIHIKLHHGKFESDVKAELLSIYSAFQLRVRQSNTFVFCDPTEEAYRFKWLVEQALAKQQ